MMNWYDHLVQSEWDDRRWRMQQRYIKNASFRYQATLEQLDYTDDRGLDKTLLQRLSGCEFIKKGLDLFITGSTGTGKSFWHPHWATDALFTRIQSIICQYY